MRITQNDRTPFSERAPADAARAALDRRIVRRDPTLVAAMPARNVLERRIALEQDHGRGRRANRLDDILGQFVQYGLERPGNASAAAGRLHRPLNLIDDREYSARQIDLLPDGCYPLRRTNSAGMRPPERK